MVDAFDVLLGSSSTVVVAEHGISVAASVDWLFDLGRGAGPDGGAVVAEGPPDTVAAADTATAVFLRRYAVGLPLLETWEGRRRFGAGARPV